MRMAANHLLVHIAANVVDRELARIGGDLALQHYLQQHVAELLAQMNGIARLDGIDRLVGFFDHVLGNALVRLLAIPRASARRPKRRYRIDELVEFFVFSHRYSSLRVSHTSITLIVHGRPYFPRNVFASVRSSWRSWIPIFW